MSPEKLIHCSGERAPGPGALWTTWTRGAGLREHTLTEKQLHAIVLNQLSSGRRRIELREGGTIGEIWTLKKRNVEFPQRFSFGRLLLNHLYGAATKDYLHL